MVWGVVDIKKQAYTLNKMCTSLLMYSLPFPFYYYIIPPSSVELQSKQPNAAQRRTNSDSSPSQGLLYWRYWLSPTAGYLATRFDAVVKRKPDNRLLVASEYDRHLIHVVTLVKLGDAILTIANHLQNIIPRARTYRITTKPSFIHPWPHPNGGPRR